MSVSPRDTELDAPPAGAPVLTTEDRKRARDRQRVRTARCRGRSPLLVWLLLGPGILALLGENDGPSMLSYAQTGAQFGIGFFVPFIACLFLMAYVVQEMTVRLGAATHRGHAELIFDRFGPFWGWFSLGDLAFGNFLTLITEFIAIRAGLGYFGVPPLVAVIGALLLIVAATATARYWTWERIVLALAIFNGLFVPAALFAHPDWGAIGQAFLTWGPLPGGLTNSTILLLLSNIGATVTPWMLFFQQSATADKGMTADDVRQGRLDTALGAGLAALFAVATVVATAPLFAKGIHVGSFQGADFAQALAPILGPVGAALFALGIFEAGLVAAITISTSSAYAFGEVTGRARSLNRGMREEAPFYTMLLASAAGAAVLVLLPGMPLVFVVEIVNVIAVLAMPPALVLLYLLCNDRQIMGSLRSSRAGNLAALAVVVFLVGAGVLFGVTVVFPHLFGS
ncbi:MAG: NRAMP family divalent metal transporter [Chloroflexia bacterium]